MLGKYVGEEGRSHTASGNVMETSWGQLVSVHHNQSKICFLQHLLCQSKT